MQDRSVGEPGDRLASRPDVDQQRTRPEEAGHRGLVGRAHAGADRIVRIVLEARRLLRYTDMTAAMIGYSLGFDDPSYFTRFFTRETGLAPRQYRSS